MVKPLNNFDGLSGGYTHAPAAVPVFSALNSASACIALCGQSPYVNPPQLAEIVGTMVAQDLRQAIEELGNMHVADITYLPAINLLRTRMTEAYNTPGLAQHLGNLHDGLVQAELSALKKANAAFNQYGLWSANHQAVTFFTDFVCNASDRRLQNAAAAYMRASGVEPYALGMGPAPAPAQPMHPNAGMAAPRVHNMASAQQNYTLVAPMPVDLAQQARALDTQSPLADPIRAHSDGYKALENMMSDMEHALHVRQDPTKLRAAITHLRGTVMDVQQHIESLSEYTLLQSRLRRNYRTLMASANLRCSNEQISGDVPKLFREFAMYIVNDDAESLELFDTFVRAAQHSDDVEYMRTDVVAIARYSLDSHQRQSAADLIERMDKLPGAPMRDTKQKTLRAAGDALPEGIDKVVTLRSVSGKVYHTSGTLQRGTFGKYRIAVDADGRRWAVKVFRLNDEAADGLRLSARDENSAHDVPTASASRGQIDAEKNALNAGSVHLDIVDMLEIDGKLYAVMTPMEDELYSIRKRIPDTNQRAAVIEYAFHELLKELSGMHDKNMVHGDFKAANALVGGDGLVAAADFGSAETVHPTDILPFSGLSSTYPPPDYHRGWGKDADMWALGVMFMSLHTTERSEPFAHSVFKAGSAQVKSYKSWYKRILRDDNGEIFLDQLPTDSAEDRKWTAYFDGARRQSPKTCRLVLQGLLDPDARTRATGHEMLMNVHLTAQTRDVAIEALKNMASSGSKEAQYRALESVAADERLFESFVKVPR